MSLSCTLSSFSSHIRYHLHSSPHRPSARVSPRKLALPSLRLSSPSAGSGAPYPLYGVARRHRLKFPLAPWADRSGVVDDDSVGGGGFGGGGGGGQEGGKSGGEGDGEDMPKELQSRPLPKRKVEAIARAIRYLLQLVAPGAEVVLCYGCSAVFPNHHQDVPYAVGDSTNHLSDNYVDDNCNLSRDINSSPPPASGVPPMFLDRNENTKKTIMLHVSEQIENHTTKSQKSDTNSPNTNSAMEKMEEVFYKSDTNSPNTNSAMAKMEGFLASVDSGSANLFTTSLAIFGLSLTIPLAPNTQLKYGETWMQVITIGSLITYVSSWFLSSYSSYFKNMKSIDDAEYQYFKVLMLIVCLFLHIVICIMLRFCAKISIPVILPVGIIGAALILGVWFWNFFVRLAKILKYLKESDVGGNKLLPKDTSKPSLATGSLRIPEDVGGNGLLHKNASDPALATGPHKVLQKWTKSSQGKNGSRLRPRETALGLPGERVWTT